jgi:hypothetical protein
MQDHLVGERIVSSIDGAGNNWIFTCKRMRLDPNIMPHTKMNSKKTSNLSIKAKIRKLLEERTGVKLCDLGFGNNSLIRYQKHGQQKEKQVSRTSFTLTTLGRHRGTQL